MRAALLAASGAAGGSTVVVEWAAMASPNERPVEDDVESVDDLALEAALDEAEVEAAEPAEEVFAAIDAMPEAIGRAVA